MPVDAKLLATRREIEDVAAHLPSRHLVRMFWLRVAACGRRDRREPLWRMHDEVLVAEIARRGGR